jgi:hypothetical protein
LEIPIEEKMYEKITKPKTISNMPVVTRMAFGIPSVEIHSASPPGVSNPNEKLTPSWIIAVGPHKSKGRTNDCFLRQSNRDVSTPRIKFVSGPEAEVMPIYLSGIDVTPKICELPKGFK